MKVFAEKGIIYLNNSSSGLKEEAIPQSRGKIVMIEIKISKV
jgi:hypothetical protein